MGEADTVGEHNNERKGEFPFPNTEESEKKYMRLTNSSRSPAKQSLPHRRSWTAK